MTFPMLTSQSACLILLTVKTKDLFQGVSVLGVKVYEGRTYILIIFQDRPSFSHMISKDLGKSFLLMWLNIGTLSTYLEKILLTC